MSQCVGPECQGCSSGDCYAKGGDIEGNEDEFEPRETKSAMDPEKHQKGVHESSRFGTRGVSMAGEDQRTGLDSKEDHRRVLGELKMMKKPKLYAEGGAVDSWTKREDNERGVHGSVKGGTSTAGIHVRHAHEGSEDPDSSMRSAKLHHKKVLGDMKAMPRPNLYAKGGDVGSARERETLAASRLMQHQEANRHKAGWYQTPEYKDLGDEHRSAVRARQKAERGEKKMADGGEVSEDDGGDDELKHAMGGEFMDAMERKDRKGIMSTLEAIVLSCRGKE